MKHLGHSENTRETEVKMRFGLFAPFVLSKRPACIITRSRAFSRKRRVVTEKGAELDYITRACTLTHESLVK